MSATLVLDLGYQPHRVVSWQRAVCLLLQHKAEPVENYDEVVYDKTFIIKMPAVVRLLSKVARKKAVRFSRMNVLTRDNWTCQYCGKKFPTHELNYDHVVPRSQGGQTVWDNIVTSCYPCNDKKRDLTPAQAGLRLRKQPYKPTSLPVIAFHVDDVNNVPELWRSWLYWNAELKS